LAPGRQLCQQLRFFPGFRENKSFCQSFIACLKKIMLLTAARHDAARTPGNTNVRRNNGGWWRGRPSRTAPANYAKRRSTGAIFL
jgi:hypothetical protein